MLQKYDTKHKMSTDEPVTFIDVYEEFNQQIAEKYQIARFKSKVTTGGATSCSLLIMLFQHSKLVSSIVIFLQKTTMDYAFEKQDVPAQCDYLEVLYSVSVSCLVHCDFWQGIPYMSCGCYRQSTLPSRLTWKARLSAVCLAPTRQAWSICCCPTI